MKVTVRTAGYHGAVTKTVALKSDDPVRPDVSLKVKMVIAGSVLMLPSSRLLLRYRPGQPAVAKMAIRQDPTESGALEITELAGSEPWLTTRLRKADTAEALDRGFTAAPGDYILEVEVPDSPGGGVHRSEVSFRTGLDREPVIRIPVTVTARAFGAPSVRQLSLRRRQPGEPMGGQMNFRLLPAVAPEDVQVSVSPDRYKVEVHTTVQGHLQVMVAEDPDNDGDQPLPQGVLKFTRGGETVSVPVIPAGE